MQALLSILETTVQSSSLISSRRQALIALGGSLTAPAWAQSSKPKTAPWPTQPLRIVVGFPGGSSPDMLARLMIEPLSKALGQSVIVDNKPGAGGNLGVDFVAKARDGHTIGLTGNGPLTSAKFLYSKLPYDPNREARPRV